jgi:hypothetical protein
MKLRTGFVANSSSSSFVVGLPNAFEPTRPNIKNLFFPALSQIYSPRFAKYLSVEVAIEILYAQMRHQSPNQAAKILHALEGHLPGGPDFTDPKYHRGETEDNDLDWDKYEHDVETHRVNFWAQMSREMAEVGQDAWVFELDNETTPEAILVDAEIFEPFVYIRVDQG